MIFPFMGHLAMFGTVLVVTPGGGVLLATSGLLNTLQYTEQSVTTKSESIVLKLRNHSESQTLSILDPNYPSVCSLRGSRVE